MELRREDELEVLERPTERADVPLELIVAVDISGSMTPSMTKLKTAVKAFLGDVPPQDAVTLLGFNDSVFALTRKTTDLAERMRAVIAARVNQRRQANALCEVCGDTSDWCDLFVSTSDIGPDCETGW